MTKELIAKLCDADFQLVISDLNRENYSLEQVIE